MLEQQVQALLDRQACEDILIRYGRTLDWLDEAGQRSCFWPDAEVDYGFFFGSGEDWVPVVMAVEAAAPRRWHGCAGALVNVDGDRASGESYGISVGTSTAEDGELVDTMFGGRYLDEFEKRDGEWRISRRQYICDWVQHFPNGVAQLESGDFVLNILQVLSPGHGAYRQL